MSTILVRHAERVITMDDARSQFVDGAVYIRDNLVEQVGSTGELPATADRVIEAGGQVVVPGLINTHHHLFQTLTRAVPDAQNAAVGGWISALVPLWDRITPEGLYVAALVGLGELFLSGCTTTCDHLYFVPKRCRGEDEARAARESGMRFHLCYGRTPPPGSSADPLTQDEILRDCQDTIERYHDPARGAMFRVAISGSLVYDPPTLQRELRCMTQSLGVGLHSHVAETADQARSCVAKFGHRLVEHADAIGWLGPDVWFAHGVHLNDDELGLLARTGTGVAHCPSSNMRLGSGIAPVAAMLGKGIHVGVGVDGSASNDSSDLLAEARQAMLLQRVANGPSAMTAEQALEMATRGGARVLRRDDIGQLKPGAAADLAAFDLNVLELAGALRDPLAALVFCAPQRARWVMVDGRLRVWDGQLLGPDWAALVARHNELSGQLFS